MPEMLITINAEPIDLINEQAWLAQCEQDGAIVTFMGKVRNNNQQQQVKQLIIEHYPGMTEKILTDIINKACERWPLSRVRVIHRIGNLVPNELIVFVGVSCAHRASAFAAAEFIMDYLKTEVPFWKKERTHQEEYWLTERHEDQVALEKWQLIDEHYKNE